MFRLYGLVPVLVVTMGCPVFCREHMKGFFEVLYKILGVIEADGISDLCDCLATFG